jgi:hypothetical protein
MKNKKEIAIICRKCGVRFGEDNRAFEIGKKWEKSLCYVCKMESMTKKQLQKFAELQFKR